VRRPRWPFAAAGALAIVALVALLATRGGDAPAPAAHQAAKAPVPSTLAAGPLRVRLPAGWSERAADGLGALALDGAAVAGPPGDAGGTVVVGLGALSPTLLPDALAGAAPAPAAETLAGGLSAYRYDGLDLGGGHRAVLYAVPTEAGVATVACRQPVPADDGFARGCAGIARSLAITGTKAFPAGPDARYARAVSAAVRSADPVLASTALRRAKTPAGQAKAVGGARGRLDAARAALAGFEVGPVDRAPHAALTAALAVLAQGYGSLASAAEHSQRERYATARAKIRSGRDAAAGALADLRAAGYDHLPALSTPVLAPLRPKPEKPRVTPTAPSSQAPRPTPTPSAPVYTPPAITPSTPQSKYGPRKGSTPGNG
jgi:hypothetical protein